MKGTTYKMHMIPNEEGDFEKIERFNDTVFDESQIFSFTILNDEFGEPEFIEILTRNGVQCTLVYNENLLINLAQNFRERGITS